MMEGYIVWSLFALCGAVIVYTGPKLSRYGDVIAEKTGLGRTWIGVLLLALVTSLPEVATSASAAFLELPDIVFGNVFGSNMFNLLIIAILDFLTPRAPLLKGINRNHLMTSGYGMLMMALALLPLLLYNIPGLGLEPLILFGFADITSLLLILVYIVGMFRLFSQEQQDETENTSPDEPLQYGDITQAKATGMFFVYGLIIISAGIGMSILADRIATYTVPFLDNAMIGQSLVGVILLAVVTSLPELMVCIGALRIGAVDMAIGNVLGSNMFNMLIIGFSDLFYSQGSILGRGTIAEELKMTGLGSHVVTALAGMIMLGIVSSEIARRNHRKGSFGFSSVLLVIIFIAAYALLFMINF